MHINVSNNVIFSHVSCTVLFASSPITGDNHMNLNLNLSIPGAAECDFDVCKNVLHSIVRLHAISVGQLNANRLCKTQLNW